MMKTRIASLALAGVLALGATTTAFAAEPVTPTAPEKPAISIAFDKEAKLAEMAEKKATVEAKKDEFAQKGIGFETAKAAMEAKLMESGKTAEEIAAMMEKFTAKFDEMKSAKGIDVAAKQAEREANVAMRAEKGIIKGGQTAGEAI